jgi:hypothetical protein
MKPFLLVSLMCAAVAVAQSPTQKDSPMSHRATGTFDVKITPLESSIKEDKAFGRLGGDKQYRGDLDGTAKAEMVAYGTGAAGSSGAIVGIEKVTGKLAGKSGSFVLAHRGLMSAGKQSYSVVVVPGTGTGELTDIDGKMDIIIEAGKHSYVFEYTLP